MKLSQYHLIDSEGYESRHLHQWLTRSQRTLIKYEKQLCRKAACQSCNSSAVLELLPHLQQSDLAPPISLLPHSYVDPTRPLSCYSWLESYCRLLQHDLLGGVLRGEDFLGCASLAGGALTIVTVSHWVVLLPRLLNETSHVTVLQLLSTEQILDAAVVKQPVHQGGSCDVEVLRLPQAVLLQEQGLQLATGIDHRQFGQRTSPLEPASHHVSAVIGKRDMMSGLELRSEGDDAWGGSVDEALSKVKSGGMFQVARGRHLGWPVLEVVRASDTVQARRLEVLLRKAIEVGQQRRGVLERCLMLGF